MAFITYPADGRVVVPFSRSSLFRRESIHYRSLLPRNRWNIALTALAGGFALICILPLGLVLGYVLFKGGTLINWTLLTSLPPAPGMEGGGIGNAILGTIIITAVASLISVPVGIGVGVFLAEYSRDNAFAQCVRFGTDILAGIPSIICGVFIYGLVVSTRLFFGQSYSAFAGGAALSVLMLPTVIKTTDEALKLVPDELRWGAFGIGASKFMVITRITLPAAFSPISTGVILAIARATGETAPLIFTALFSPFWPEGIFNPIASMSVLIYNFAIMPYEAQISLSWAASFVLVMMILAANLFARWLGRMASPTG